MEIDDTIGEVLTLEFFKVLLGSLVAKTMYHVVLLQVQGLCVLMF